MRASGTIYIKTDGSIDPPTAPIQRNGGLYTLTGNITSDSDGIMIERKNMTVDGAGDTVQGIEAWDYRGIFAARKKECDLHVSYTKSHRTCVFEAKFSRTKDSKDSWQSYITWANLIARVN